MSYILPSGRQVTSEVLLKIETEDLPGLPVACKVCPAAMWQLTGTPEAPQARCFCRVMHVLTWSSQHKEEILDCDLIYQAEEAAEEKKAAQEAKQEEKELREARKAEEKAEKEENARKREERRQEREQQKADAKAEREEKARHREEQKAQEKADKEARARKREADRQARAEEKANKANTRTPPPGDDIPMTPEAVKNTAMPGFQEWADQVPPSTSEEDMDQETDN
ncbi:hypothetical protein SAMN04487787_12826 [Kosakonia sacchari]|nr:hypothetical protein SAMN04487787_12826 [Kosakonia sacchari]